MKLKTLKNMSFEECFKDYEFTGSDKEFKALKSGFYDSQKFTKQELIKWYKEIHKLAMNNLDSPLPIHFEGMVFTKDTIFGAEIIIKKIFNLSESDLK